MAEQVLFSCEGAKSVVCTIEFDPPLDSANPKATHYSVKAYVSLKLKQFRQLYLIADTVPVYGFKRDKFTFTAPEGSIIHVYYRTGSHKNSYILLHASFLVREKVRESISVINEAEKSFHAASSYTIKTENLQYLQPLTQEQRAIVEAEVANRFGAKLSLYDPVELLYWYWVKQPPTAPAPVPAAPEEELPEQLPEEPELTLTVAPPPAPAPTAVQKTPPQPASLVEEAREALSKILREKGYVEVKLVVFDLPTEYQGARSRIEITDEGLVEQKVLDPKKTSMLRSLRRSFYAELNRHAARTKAGWLLLSEELPGELKELIDAVNEERPGSVEVINIILPRDWLQKEVEDWTKRLEATINYIAEQLADEAVSDAMRRRLERRRKEVEAALARAKAYLDSLLRR